MSHVCGNERIRKIRNISIRSTCIIIMSCVFHYCQYNNYVFFVSLEDFLIAAGVAFNRLLEMGVAPFVLIPWKRPVNVLLLGNYQILLYTPKQSSFLVLR